MIVRVDGEALPEMSPEEAADIVEEQVLSFEGVNCLSFSVGSFKSPDEGRKFLLALDGKIQSRLDGLDDPPHSKGFPDEGRKFREAIRLSEAVNNLHQQYSHRISDY